MVVFLTLVGDDYARVRIEAGLVSQRLVNGLTEPERPIVCVEACT